jgi:hypothetical protein
MYKFEFLDKKLFVTKPCLEQQVTDSSCKDPNTEHFIGILISYMIRQLSPMRFC